MENKNHVILDIENLTAAFQIHKSRVVAVRESAFIWKTEISLRL